MQITWPVRAVLLRASVKREREREMLIEKVETSRTSPVTYCNAKTSASRGKNVKNVFAVKGNIVK
jgi:hypothetical protein